MSGPAGADPDLNPYTVAIPYVFEFLKSQKFKMYRFCNMFERHTDG